jgi:hypothetical protein
MKGSIRMTLGLLCFFVAAGEPNEGVGFLQHLLWAGSFMLAGLLIGYSGYRAAEGDVSH